MKKWQKLEYELRKYIEQELYVLNIKGKDTEYVRGLIDARCNEKYELWFYGCYETEETAKEVSRTIKGVYFEIAESEV